VTQDLHPPVSSSTPIEHVYIHIPFCPKKCPYCCFFVEEGSRNKTTAFLDALVLELSRAAQTRPLAPKTLYFGGGTPTALLLEQWEYLLKKLRSVLDLSKLEEWTVEANPATVRHEKAQLLAEAGVTRMSLGVQSWNPATLKTLGRVHSAAQALKTYEILRKAAFPQVNLDLMFSIPGQSLAEWQQDLQISLDLQPDHLSAYSLTYEEDTDYFQKLHSGQFVPNEELDADLFECTMDELEAAGYRQYEISNYARPGAQSKHNRAYWEGRDFTGIGPSAFSNLPGERTQNVCDTAEYTRRVLAGQDPVSFRETIPPTTRRREQIAFGIRMEEGIPSAWLKPRKEGHPSNLGDEVERWLELERFEDQGLLSLSEGRIRLTRKGRLVADSIAQALM
jgi:oxygen-independent coproporphyrinogen-3 oxidase